MKFPRTSRHHDCSICSTKKSKCGWKADNPSSFQTFNANINNKADQKIDVAQTKTVTVVRQLYQLD
jgi:hypothetical protein